MGITPLPGDPGEDERKRKAHLKLIGECNAEALRKLCQATGVTYSPALMASPVLMTILAGDDRARKMFPKWTPPEPL